MGQIYKHTEDEPKSKKQCIRYGKKGTSIYCLQ